VVRGAEAEVLEGVRERRPEERVVVVEFASAREWYGSEEHAEARRIAETALTRRLTPVEGYGVKS
jgi:uncharacterized protein (DUF1330 family)